MSDNFIQENSEIITLRAMANVFMPEALDPVGQEDDDVDNDGDSDKSDEYLKKRRKAVGAAIDKRKKKLKEAASADAHTSDDDDKEITEKKVKNKVIINPEMKESKDYDPMEDDEFDHDEAEENRGVSGKNNPKGGRSLYKKKKVKKVNEIYLSAPSPKKEDKKDAKKKETWYDRDERKRKEHKEEVEQVDEIAPAVALGLGAAAMAPWAAKKFLKPQADKALDNATKNSNLPLSTGGGTADLRKAKQAAGMQVNSYDPEGEQLDENPVEWLRDKITKKNNQSSNPTPRLKRGAGALGSYANRSNAAGGDAFANAVDRLQNSYEPEGEQLNERPYQVMGYDKEGGKEKKVGKPVKSRKYADARAAELSDTHKKTGGKYRSQYVEAAEDRARDRRQERGGVAGNVDYSRPPAKKLSNKELGIDPKAKTWVQKQMEKKKGK